MNIIKNRNELESKKLEQNHLYLRRIALNCLENALDTVKPKNLVKKAVKIKNNELFINQDVYDLEQVKKIYIIGGGKASARMAASIENILRKNGYLNYVGFLNVQEGL